MVHEAIAECVTVLMFLPHFDVFCDPLLNRRNMESTCLYDRSNLGTNQSARQIRILYINKEYNLNLIANKGG